MTESLTPPLPRDLFTAEQVRAMDRYAIAELGTPGIELMEKAGAAAFSALRRRWPEARFLSVVCGGGNNGGDGYVIARLALAEGLDVRVYAVTPPAHLKGDALRAFLAYREAGGEWLDYIPAQLEAAEVVVDALFGTGLDRDVSGHHAAIIKAINESQAGVLAVDIPSGLNADTGAVMGCAVHADSTVTFIGLKRGLFTGAGLAYSGEIVFDDLGTPPVVRRCVAPSAQLVQYGDYPLPLRPRDAHKGHFGHVLVIGGDLGYSGAARLAAEAAARAGAGLVTVATRPEHAVFLNLTRPELMCRGVATAAELEPLLHRASVVAIGPGLGQAEWGQGMLSAALSCELPMIVDADAVNLLAQQPARRDDWILTPHPGEAARLLQTSTANINRDRFAAAARLQERYGGVVVLKGSGSLVLGSDALPCVSTTGNPGMATGGMGDVLTGVIAGLVAQGLAPLTAAVAGVQLHGAAGDLAATTGERGLLAGDLMEHVRALVNQ